MPNGYNLVGALLAIDWTPLFRGDPGATGRMRDSFVPNLSPRRVTTKSFVNNLASGHVVGSFRVSPRFQTAVGVSPPYRSCQCTRR